MSGYDPTRRHLCIDAVHEGPEHRCACGHTWRDPSPAASAPKEANRAD